MAVSSPATNPQSAIANIKRAIGKITLPWGITIGYLSLMLFL
ncbi:MAG: sulfate ABC transporter permease subunit CysT, partial [Oscillatoriales cyanobacterium]